MKRKKSTAKSLVMLPLFKQRVVGAKRGKGSYTRKSKHKDVKYA